MLNPNTNGAYLSIDGGTTNLVNFNNPGNGGDLLDYKGDVVTDPYNAFTGTNSAKTISAAGITNMDVVGWDLIQQRQGVPEPGAIAFFCTGIVSAGLLVRRRNK